MIQELRPVALLMTDVVGSTRLEQLHGPRFLDWLQAHVDLAVSIAHQHNGEVLKHRGEGDSLFSAFDRPADAIACAIAWQLAFEKIPPPGEPIKVRMAIDFGEAYALASDFWGGLVNRCARIREVSQGGQILVSGPAQSQSPQDCIDLGTHVLRDVQEPIQLFQVRAEGLAQEFAPIRNPLHLAQLPSYGSSFQGRHEDRSQLRRFITENRLVSILGPGGSGKTRLGVEVAGRSAHQFPGGVVHVDLVTIDSAEALVQAIANRLDAVAVATNLNELAAKISSNQVLIVLDNADSMIAAAREVIAALLTSTQRPRFIVTSREALGLPDERRHIIGSLGADAALLLMDRASACGAVVNNDPSSTQIYQQLAQAVDGLPLGIELLAPMLAAMNPREALALLKDYSALEIEATGGSARHRSLEGVLSWSFERLTEADRSRLVALGMFVGPFPLDAAAAVWQESPWAAAQSMKNLVEKSLVQFEARTGLQGQYRLLGTTAAFARRTEINDVTQRRFVDYYSKRAQLLDADLRRQQNPETFSAWDAANANVMHALKLAIQLDEIEKAMSLVQSTLLFRSWRAGLGELTELAMVLAPKIPSTPSAGRAEFLNSLAVLLMHSSRRDEAQSFAEQSLEDSTARGDLKHRAKVLLNLALMASLDERNAEAIGACRAAADAFRETGDQKNLAITLCNLGAMLNSEMSQAEAKANLEEAIALLTKLHDRANLVLAEQNLAEVHLKCDEPKEALQAILRSAQAAEALQLQASLSQAAALAAIAYIKSGQIERANELWSLHIRESSSGGVLRDDPLEKSYPHEVAILRRTEKPAEEDSPSVIELLRVNADA